MGEARTPLFAYVDESGNTGRNIFDTAQPDYYTAALVSRGDFDRAYGDKVRAIAAKVGADAIHANELGLGRLELIATDLLQLLERAGASFFVSRVEKKYLLATKMFDTLFDSGENAAVPWHAYNLRPLKIIAAMKLGAVLTEEIARDFWKCLLMPREADARAALPPICEAIKARLHILPDARSREILGAGLDWVIAHPECVQFATEQKLAKQGHFPNLVAFANLLEGLQNMSGRLNKKIASIVHDEQNEFGRSLDSWHGLFSNASPDIIEWGGESYSLQRAPGSLFLMKPDHESPGIQMADVALWLYGQWLKGKALPENCERLLVFILANGWQNDFSFKGVEQSLLDQFGEVMFGDMAEEKLEAGRALVKMSEERRLASMAQYEVDGVPPFMRTPPPAVSADEPGTLLT